MQNFEELFKTKNDWVLENNTDINVDKETVAIIGIFGIVSITAMAILKGGK